MERARQKWEEMHQYITTQLSISDGNKIAIFTFQYWGLALQAMQTPTAYDEGWRHQEHQGSEDALPNDERCKLPQRRSSAENQVGAF